MIARYTRHCAPATTAPGRNHAVVLTPWPDQPSAIHESNRATIARLGAVEVATLAPLSGPAELAAAGAKLAPERWLQDL